MGEPRRTRQRAVRTIARLLYLPTLLVAAAILVKGFIQTGDDFSAGVVGALGVLLRYLAFGHEEQTERLRSAGGTVAGAHLRKGRPAEEIVALAEELDAGLVVLGSRGLGAVKRLVVGSVAEGVASLAPCPVLVVRGGEGAWPPSRIVVGDDPSEGAEEAGEVAVAMAATLGAGVSLVRAYSLFLDISEAAKLAEDVAVPLQIALRRHELSLEGRAGAGRRARAQSAVQGEGG